MKIETRYNLDDVVYGVTLEKEYKDVTCLTCSGEGCVQTEHGKNYCPTCDGALTVYSHAGYKFVITPFIIKTIILTSSGVEYSPNNKNAKRARFYTSKKFVEDNVFASYEEAEKDIEDFKKTDEWKNKNF